MKILIVVHGHPKYSHGGGEVSSYSMYQALKKAGHTVNFLAYNNLPGAGDSGRSITKVAPDEWLISTKTDWFTFSSSDLEGIEAFKTMVGKLKPDVIHFHHFLNLGIELPLVAKQVLPGVKVIFTLHEYLLICNRDGQMITTKDELCMGASPENCNKCFPQFSKEAFFLKEGYFKNCLSAVDQFLAPSHFLRERFITWGIPKERISYLENILTFDRKAKISDKFSKIKRFGYFGQINRYKGLDILLDALESIVHIAPKIKLVIHGNFSIGNSPEYQAYIEQKMKNLEDYIEYKGPYSSDQLVGYMNDIGWLVMSSRWWENSPVVIQEALAYKTPVILPNFGGMQEKMGNNGYLYEAMDSESLGKVMLKASNIKQSDYKKFKIDSQADDISQIKQLMSLYKS